MKIFKMDFYKLSQKKGFLIFICFILLFTLSSAFAYSNASENEMNSLLQDFTSMKYIWIASTDVLYQGSTLFSLMLLGIILANLYFEDFKTGCYKYIIMTGVNKINFFYWKVTIYNICSIGVYSNFFYLCDDNRNFILGYI